MRKRRQPAIDQRVRVRAAVAWLNGRAGYNQEDNEACNLGAFMAIFHPEKEPMTPSELRDAVRKE